MKIIMALASLDIGGAETHVVELSKEIKRRGHDVVMISGGGVYQKEIEEFGIKHYTVPLKSRNYKNIIKACGMIKKIIKRWIINWNSPRYSTNLWVQLWS